jgi:hypothetical protein
LADGVFDVIDECICNMLESTGYFIPGHERNSDNPSWVVLDYGNRAKVGTSDVRSLAALKTSTSTTRDLKLSNIINVSKKFLEGGRQDAEGYLIVGEYERLHSPGIYHDHNADFPTAPRTGDLVHKKYNHVIHFCHPDRIMHRHVGCKCAADVLASCIEGKCITEEDIAEIEGLEERAPPTADAIDEEPPLFDLEEEGYVTPPPRRTVLAQLHSSDEELPTWRPDRRVSAV